MKCPNCNQEMNHTLRFVELTFFTGDEPDYYPVECFDVYQCNDCSIKCDGGKWTVPDGYILATNKQIKCVNFINRQLGTCFEPVLKSSTWQFIKDNLQNAKEVYDNSFTEWCEDNSDWLPEYY